MKLITFTFATYAIFFEQNVKHVSASPPPFFLYPNLCLTDHCKKLGLTLRNSLNTSVNPCEDFYRYACDGWRLENKKPPSEIVWNHFNSIASRVNKRVQKILEEKDGGRNGALQKARIFYRACVDVNRIRERLYLHEFRLLIEDLGGWSLVSEFWNDLGYHWLKHVAEVNRFLGVYPIVKMHVDVDFENTSRHVLYVDPGTFVMPRSILIHPQNNAVFLLKYRQWILETARHVFPRKLDARHRIHADIHEMIELESELAKLTLRESKHVRITMEDLSGATNISWKPVFQTLFSETDVNITGKELVLYSATYMDSVFATMEKFTPRAIANYILWSIIKTLSRDVSQQLRRLSFMMDNLILDVQADVPRQQECVSKVNENLGAAIISRYAQHYLKPGVLQAVQRMAQRIKFEFVELLWSNKWLGEATKKSVVEKILAVKFLVGFPQWMTNTTLIDEVYRKETISNDHFVNVLCLRRLAVKRQLEELNKTVDKVRWPNNPLEINGFYSVLQNTIIIPLGMLELPFFDVEQPAVFNYGALGSLIGHEISHALDTIGRQADKNGNIRQWWSPEDITKYESKVHCFERHYAKYGVDGVNTVGENIADNVGVLISHGALSNQVSYAVVPYLHAYSREQLFFISYAQLWCESSDFSGSTLMLQEDHAPVHVRVMATMNNNKDFQKIFNCPKSNVNNCVLW